MFQKNGTPQGGEDNYLYNNTMAIGGMDFSVEKWNEFALKYTLFLRNVDNHHTPHDILMQNVYEGLSLG